MKKILFVLAACITIVSSCNEADKTADANNPTAADSTAAKDSLDKMNAISQAANNPSTPQEKPIDTASLTTIQWLDGQNRDFGKMKDGENLDVSFRFKNTGNKPLIISRVWAQCGCTVAETPRKPYAPGETGVIKAAFNSSGKPGLNSKEVYMSANTNPSTSTLVFRVEVKSKSK
ncbi:MAG TPA: DUF1573 domain-containing protein [Chitinophagaceae bacterium]|jgi:hypothetical protein|nr:DUF1573 domain-containing protein [Chitinophagaceae bacterium]